MKSSVLSKRMGLLHTAPMIQMLREIKHGIERESLRVDGDGRLNCENHHQALGSALKNQFITTDFSESLLEFITPPIGPIAETLARLQDVHKFTQEQLGEQLLWPNSMPCFVGDQNDIRIARYGNSNLGKMKTLYREGLRHRYGNMMQVIAGVHYNFSLPEGFFQSLNSEPLIHADVVSQGYFDLIRNYQQLSWLIAYLFGASPALCQSFLQGQQNPLPFQRVGKGTLYLPYATSLRMSDLGYTNDAQSVLNIDYNTMQQYIDSVRLAIHTPAPEYQQYQVATGEIPKQLNANILQIENELYSTIRPKQPTHYLEKPTDALAERGVEYVEVRALDLQPDASIGITSEQCHFLDVFLVYCALCESPKLSNHDHAEIDANMHKVVIEGRKPGLQLQNRGKAVSLSSWASQSLAQMKEVAVALDKANDSKDYSDALQQQQDKVDNPELTPSAQLLETLLGENIDLGELGCRQATAHKAQFSDHGYSYYSAQTFSKEAQRSHAAQAELENNDELQFERFLQQYFAKN